MAQGHPPQSVSLLEQATAGIAAKLCLEGCVAQVTFTRHLKHVE